MDDNLKIDGLEAINIEDIVINRGDGLDVKLNGLRAFGASKFQIEKLRVNPVTLKVDVLVVVPKIKTTSKYTLQMALGVINLKGEGNMTAELG